MIQTLVVLACVSLRSQGRKENKQRKRERIKCSGLRISYVYVCMYIYRFPRWH